MHGSGHLASLAHAILRIVSGALFAFHGVQKVFGELTTKPKPPVGSQLWIGGMIELVGGIMIAFGLFTRPVAFLASGTMAVAYFQFHWKGVLTEWKFLPIVNGGELAVVYCFVFLLFAAAGAGPLSIDRARGR